MYALFAGLGLFLLLLFGSRYLAYADTSKLARGIRRFGWVALLLLGGLLLLPGLFVIALPLAMLGYSMLQRHGGVRMGGPFGGTPFGGYGQTRRSRRQKSFIRTNTLEMELDHDSGRVDGRCIGGKFAGRPLSTLSLEELRELAMSLQHGDPQEAALLAAYLNQRSPNWRESAEQARGQGETSGGTYGSGYGYGGRNGAGRKSRPSGGMSIDEAYDVLGVRRSATKDEIRSAHRQLMKKVHPDQGGSTYLAARINEAKDVLMSLR
jgi:hypothetical protein